MYLKTLKKVIIKSETFLDLVDEKTQVYHGNYQSAKKVNLVIEYMLKSIARKTHPNLAYSSGMSNLIGDLGNYKDFYQSLIDLAKEGQIEEAMEFLEQNDPQLYLKQGKKLEDRLISIYRDKILKTQSNYKIDDFYLSNEMYNSLVDYVKRRNQGENPVLAIVGNARHR